ncbi:AsmA family protein [Inquilinus sp. CAU 1745]|uniref:AsmA family protein n=1 Tax=Inquilinus sp. CAU 1745 TaxID=3140369 RepID=UPI00325BC1B2
MKKILIGLAALLALLAVALVAAPSLIDWTSYRETIARQVSALTGRTVTIEGPVDFSLLPTPTLSAGRVTVANAPGGSAPHMLTLEALDLRLAALPLLTGTIRAERIALVEPTLLLEILPDGTANWEGDGLETVGARDIRLDRVSIENGTIIWRDAVADREVRVDSIFAQLSAASLEGPYQLIGSAGLHGRSVTVDLTAGRLGQAGNAQVNMVLGMDGVAGEARFAGTVFPGLFRAQGDVTASGGDLASALGTLYSGWSPPPAARAPFNISAALTAAPEGIDLNDLALTVGDARAAGALNIVLGPSPRVDLALTANRLDLDGWLPDAVREFDFLAWLRTEGAGFPRDAVATVDLSVEALTWRGDLIRDLQLIGMMEDGVVAISRLTGQLPGGTQASAVGTVRTEEGLPFADLTLDATSSDLRRLLTWAGWNLEQVPSNRLRGFDGKATVTGTAREFQVTGVDLRIDGAAVTGGLAFIDRGRPGLGLRVEIDRLDLDGYLGTGASDATLGTLLESGILPRWIEAAGTFDANVDAAIGRLTVGGRTFSGLRLDGTLQGGGLTLRHAGVEDAAGASLAVTGTLPSLDPVSNADLSLNLSTEAPADLFELLGWAPPVAAGELGDIDLTGRVRGGVDRLELQLDADIAGGALALGGAVTEPAGEQPAYDLAVRATHPDAARLLGLLGGGYRPQGLEGGLDIYAEIAGTPRDLAFRNLQGTIGAMTVAGTVDWRAGEERPFIAADLRADSVDLAALLPAGSARPPRPGAFWSDAPLPLHGLAAIDGTLALTANTLTAGGLTIADPTLRASLDDSRLTLDRLTGQIHGGALGLEGAIVAREGQPPEMNATIDLVGADLAAVLGGLAEEPGLDGTLDFGAALSGQGTTPARIAATLSGEGLVAVRDGTARGFDLTAMSAALEEPAGPTEFLALVREALSGGRTPFAALNATFEVEEGMARTDDFRLVAEAGVGEGEGEIDLARGRMDMAVSYSLHAHPDAPPFTIHYVGSLDAPRSRPEIDALQSYMADRLAEAITEPAAPENDPETPPAPAGTEGAVPEPADG